APADDTHLVHVARISLRDQLKTPEAWSSLEGLKLSDRDRRDIADIATGVHTPESAAYLAGYLKSQDETPENWSRYVHHIARYAVPDRLDDLAELVRKAGGLGRSVQAGLVKAIHQGLQERGMPPAAAVRAMAVEHARALLEAKDAQELNLGI